MAVEGGGGALRDQGPGAALRLRPPPCVPPGLSPDAEAARGRGRARGGRTPPPGGGGTRRRRRKRRRRRRGRTRRRTRSPTPLRVAVVAEVEAVVLWLAPPALRLPPTPPRRGARARARGRGRGLTRWACRRWRARPCSAWAGGGGRRAARCAAPGPDPLDLRLSPDPIERSVVRRMNSGGECGAPRGRGGRNSRNSRLQGCLGRRSSPGTRLAPRSLHPARAPRPLFSPSCEHSDTVVQEFRCSFVGGAAGRVDWASPRLWRAFGAARAADSRRGAQRGLHSGVIRASDPPPAPLSPPAAAERGANHRDSTLVCARK